MITYEKSIIDQQVITLLKKLEPNIPFESILADIENLYVSPIKVFYDEKCYGLLIVRGIINHRRQLGLIIDHAIAGDDLEISLTNILGQSLFSWAKTKGFKYVIQIADRKGLARMLEKFYGEPIEWTYKKELDQCLAENQETAHQKQVNPQPRQTTL